MNLKNIVVGDIMLCGGFKGVIGIDEESKPIKYLFEKGVVLVKIDEDKYIDIRNYNSFLDLMLKIDKLYKASNWITNPYYKILFNYPSVGGEYFVDEESVHSYYTEEKNISLRQLKQRLNQN